jgi:4-amino-4-deoxy-L-arabinose transferase-like glycosyltransferase
LTTITVAILVTLPWELYSFTSWPQVYLREQRYTLQHFIEPVEDHRGPFWYYLERLARHERPRGIGCLILIALGGFLYEGAIHRSMNLVFVLAWAVGPIVVFSLAATKMPAYTTVALPALLIREPMPAIN